MNKPKLGIAGEDGSHGDFFVSYSEEVFFDVSKMSEENVLRVLREMPPEADVIRSKGRIYCPADHVRGFMPERSIKAFDAMVKVRRKQAIDHVKSWHPAAVARKAVKRVFGTSNSDSGAK